VSANRASDSRAEGTSTWATATPGSGSPSVTISVAPRRTASGTKRRASCRSPGIATKQLPGSTRRESSVMDETDDGGAPTTVLAGSAARSSLTGIRRDSISSDHIARLTARRRSARTATHVTRPWLEREPGGDAGPEWLSGLGRLPDDAAPPPDLHRDVERRERGERAPERPTREVRHHARSVGVDRRVGADEPHGRGHSGHRGLRRRPGDDRHGLAVARHDLEVAQDLAADRVEDRRGRLAPPDLGPRLVEHDEHDEA